MDNVCEGDRERLGIENILFRVNSVFNVAGNSLKMHDFIYIFYLKT